MNQKIIFSLIVGIVMGTVPLRAIGAEKPKGVAEMENLKAKKIVMIIAAGDFRDEELNIPLEYFQTKGAQVRVASSVTTPVKGMMGAIVTPDMLYTDIKPAEYDAIVFVGGGGCKLLWNDEDALRLAREAAVAGKVLGAICLGGYKGFDAWRARPTPESLVPPPKEIVKPPDPTPPELKPDVKPPELKPVATDPIKPDVKAPIKLDKPDKPKKNPEVAVKTPDPIPIGPVEVREIKINLIPQIHSATIHVDGVSEVMKNQPQWELTLPVGAHVARVECPGCLSEPFQFTVETEVRVPVLKPVALQLRFRAHLEAAVEDPDAKVLVDGLEMKPTDDPSRRALDYDYSLEREEKAKIVTIQIVQEGRPTRTWSQAISAGRPMVLKPEIR